MTILTKQTSLLWRHRSLYWKGWSKLRSIPASTEIGGSYWAHISLHLGFKQVMHVPKASAESRLFISHSCLISCFFKALELTATTIWMELCCVLGNFFNSERPETNPERPYRCLHHQRVGLLGPKTTVDELNRNMAKPPGSYMLNKSSR